MPIDELIGIPQNILLPVGLKYRREFKCDPEKWADDDLARVRFDCGPSFAGVPLANIRRQLCNLRKRAKLGRVTESEKRGAMKAERPPAEYLNYLASPDWKRRKRQWLEYWDFRCALCDSNKKLDVHHRTYIRLGNERPNDCLALCRSCHNAADRARKRAIDNLSTDGDMRLDFE